MSSLRTLPSNRRIEELSDGSDDGSDDRSDDGGDDAEDEDDDYEDDHDENEERRRPRERSRAVESGSGRGMEMVRYNSRDEDGVTDGRDMSRLALTPYSDTDRAVVRRRRGRREERSSPTRYRATRDRDRSSSTDSFRHSTRSRDTRPRVPTFNPGRRRSGSSFPLDRAPAIRPGYAGDRRSWHGSIFDRDDRRSRNQGMQRSLTMPPPLPHPYGEGSGTRRGGARSEVVDVSQTLTMNPTREGGITTTMSVSAPRDLLVENNPLSLFEHSVECYSGYGGSNLRFDGFLGPLGGRRRRYEEAVPVLPVFWHAGLYSDFPLFP